MDVEAITAAKTQNASFFSRHCEEFNARNREAQKQDGAPVLMGCKIPDQDENMAWLGAGSLSSSTNVMNNLNHFPSLKRLLRRIKLEEKCHITLLDRKNNDISITDAKDWVQKIWNGECVYYVLPSSHEDEEMFFLTVRTTDDEEVGAFSASSRGYRLKLHPHLHELLEFSQEERLKTRMIHHFLRHFAYMIPINLLTSFRFTPYLESSLSSKISKEDYLDWQILQADLSLNLPIIRMDGKSPDLGGEIRPSFEDWMCSGGVESMGSSCFYICGNR